MNLNKEILFIGSFILFMIFFYMIFGKGPLYFLLWLILAGQVVVNWKTLNDLIKEVVSNV